MKFKEILRWWVPQYRQHKRRLAVYLRFQRDRSLFEEHYKSHNSHTERVEAAKAAAEMMHLKLEVEGIVDNANYFYNVRDEIKSWLREKGLNQRRQAIKSRWAKLRANRQALLNIFANRIATARMPKSDTPKRKKPSKVTSRKRKSDISYKKR